MNPDWGTEMLILTRKIGESIVIDKDIYVTILGINGNQIRLGIDAPKTIPVHREEIHLRIKAEEELNVFYKEANSLNDEKAGIVIN